MSKPLGTPTDTTRIYEMEAVISDMRATIRGWIADGHVIHEGETIISLAADYAACCDGTVNLRPGPLAAAMREALIAEGFRHPLRRWEDGL